MLIVGPDCPSSIAPLMRSILDAIRELQNPTKPQKVAKVTFANLPPAANWTDCTVEVSDKNTHAISTLTGTTWAWTRADGSAL